MKVLTVDCRLYNNAGHKRRRTGTAGPIGHSIDSLRVGVKAAQGKELQKE